MVFIAFGWVVRSLMSVRENYFGNFTHFSTLDEYVYKREHDVLVGDPVESKWKEGRVCIICCFLSFLSHNTFPFLKSNAFEVTLDLLFNRTAVVLPAGLTGYEYSLDPSSDRTSSNETYHGLGTSVLLLQQEFQVYLRTHDFSMGKG